MNEFEERFKNFEIRKLLRILEDAINYQPIAIAAAKLELSKRDISEEEVQSIKDEKAGKKLQHKQRKEHYNTIENKAKEIGSEIFENINPVRNIPQTIDRKINLIVIVFGFLATIKFFGELNLIQFMFTDSLAEWGLDMIFYFLPVFGFPVGVFLFWKRSKLGWILMNAFFLFSIIGTVAFFILTWQWNNRFINDYSSDAYGVDTSFWSPNLFTYLITIAIFVGSIWLLCNKDVRQVFQVDIKGMWKTIGVSTLVAIVLVNFI